MVYGLAMDVAKCVTYNFAANLLSGSRDSNDVRNDPDGVMARLKIVSKIEQGYQFDVNTYKIQPNSWWTSFERTILRPDCRQNTTTFIRNAINDGYMLLISKLASNGESDHVYCERLLQDILECKKGIRNICLHPRYKGDIGFVSQMETLNDRVDMIVSEVQSKYPDIHIKSNTACNTTSNTGQNTPGNSPVRGRSLSLN